MAACTIKERKLVEKLTVPISYEDQTFKREFYHTFIKEPDPTLPGSALLSLMSSSMTLDLFNNYYVEWFQGWKHAHGWLELHQLHTPVDFRHTNVKVGYRKQKCRIAYSCSYSYYPRAARNFSSEEEWNRQNESNFNAFLKAFKFYDTYKVLKIFSGEDYKKIIGENAKCNYLAEIVSQHEAKTGENEDFYTYHRSLQQRYNNAKGAENKLGGVLIDRPMCIKEDGTCCVAAGDCEMFKYKENPNRDILECLNKIIFSNKVTCTKKEFKFVQNMLETDDDKWIGLIIKLKEVIKEITTELTTKYNLAHNSADITKCSEDLKDKCKSLKKFGVEFMNCCCADDNEECFCELPKIRSASSLRILVHPMTAKRIEAIQAIFAGYKGFELISENLGGVQIIEDLCYPKDKVHLVETGFIEFVERYNVENEGEFKTPDNLKNITRHIEQEIITRFNKICCHFELPTS